jgi:hypothetical protein
LDDFSVRVKAGAACEVGKITESVCGDEPAQSPIMQLLAEDGFGFTRWDEESNGRF